MFESVQPAPPDSILGISEAFHRDPNPHKINLSVGVYQDENGATPTLAAVREMEQRLAAVGTSKSYLGISGLPEYHAAIQQLLFAPAGSPHAVLSQKRAATVQCPGGTGALKVAGDLVHRLFPDKGIWVSNPTWGNHIGVFSGAGLRVEKYRYFSKEINGLDREAFLNDLSKIPAGDVVCLHGCCHNPTGADPDAALWREIAEIVAERNLLPLIDLAYQGLGSGLAEDVAGLHAIADKVDELLVCNSFSKNFSLYNERVGGLTLVAKTAETATTMLSQLKTSIRVNYSNPPAYGARLVAGILGDESLTTSWQNELAAMRARIQEMRVSFVNTMKEKGSGDFSFLLKQQGMFSFSGLSPEQVKQLQDQHSIYIVGNGRINVAGMTPQNMPQLCEAIAAVLG